MSDNKNLTAKIKQQLDQQSVSDKTRRELRNARMAALQQSPTSPVRPAWIPATAVAGIVLITAGLLFNTLLDQPEFPPIEADDLALINGDDEFELLQELEFYLWIDAEGQV